MRLQELVLRPGIGLDLAPFAVEDVLARLDQLTRPRDRAPVERVGGHGGHSPPSKEARTLRPGPRSKRIAGRRLATSFRPCPAYRRRAFRRHPSPAARPRWPPS